jgi:hypothetical protein
MYGNNRSMLRERVKHSLSPRRQAPNCQCEQRLELLHDNVKKYRTSYNVFVADTALKGLLRRAD